MIAHDNHSHTTRRYDAEHVHRLHQAVSQLLLFHDVLSTDAGRSMRALLDLLGCKSPGAGHGSAVAEAYGRVFRALATAVGPNTAQQEMEGSNMSVASLPPGEQNAWRAYVVARVLCDENPFTNAAQTIAAEDLPPALRHAAAHDLHLLQEIAAIDGDALAATVSHVVASDAPLPSWTGLLPRTTQTVPAPVDDVTADRHAVTAMAAYLAESNHWADAVGDLALHMSRHGSGPLAGHTALRWVHSTTTEGRLVPILSPDSSRMDDLIGYDDQRRQLAHNTERFLANLPANDVLLFGARGTGKSSSVKALLTAYAHQGLRLVEVPRDALGDLAAVCTALRGRAGRYILFIDDLSFEEQETSYKDLKAVLEGRLEARPSNVRVYATSNRRHLVREQFADRSRPGAVAEGEVRAGDTAQEKLSLADRFGLVLVYTTPDQERYLSIVEGLARRRGVKLPADELRTRALRWAEWHNGRSGRTARQFVDSIVGE